MQHPYMLDIHTVQYSTVCHRICKMLAEEARKPSKFHASKPSIIMGDEWDRMMRCRRSGRGPPTGPSPGQRPPNLGQAYRSRRDGADIVTSHTLPRQRAGSGVEARIERDCRIDVMSTADRDAAGRIDATRAHPAVMCAEKYTDINHAAEG